MGWGEGGGGGAGAIHVLINGTRMKLLLLCVVQVQ